MANELRIVPRVQEDEKLYTMEELAELLGLSYKQVYLRITKHKIPSSGLRSSNGGRPIKLYSRTEYEGLISLREEEEKSRLQALETFNKGIRDDQKEYVTAQYIENLSMGETLDDVMKAYAVLDATWKAAARATGNAVNMMKTMIEERDGRILELKNEIKLLEERLAGHGTIQKYLEYLGFIGNKSIDVEVIKRISRKLGTAGFDRRKIYTNEHVSGVWTYCFADLERDIETDNFGMWPSCVIDLPCHKVEGEVEG